MSYKSRRVRQSFLPISIQRCDTLKAQGTEAMEKTSRCHDGLHPFEVCSMSMKSMNAYE